jgi:hypothetical protein
MKKFIEISRQPYNKISRDMLDKISAKHNISIQILDTCLLLRNRELLGTDSLIGQGTPACLTSDLRTGQEFLSRGGTALLLLLPDSGNTAAVVVFLDIKNVVDIVAEPLADNGNEDIQNRKVIGLTPETAASPSDVKMDQSEEAIGDDVLIKKEARQ